MNDLEQLKELLFGAEKLALDSISERVERREVRTVDVADILPEAIHQSYKKDSELVDSLTQPVGECLQRAFRDDPETYGEALYPIMGPAIRKSIMNALRNFTQQINEVTEHSLSAKGLKWRWQASRAGVPFGEFLLQKTLRYRVEQAYLISRENGLLVDHVHHEASKIKDSDAVSAMFTAIQDFVKESFSPDRTGRLESADMGDFTLWAVHGPHALLVCVIRGVPPKNLRGELTAILERIHFRYGDAIRDYRGDTSTIPDVKEELERCLSFEAREEKEEKKKGVPLPIIIALLLLLAAALFFGVRSWIYAQQLQEFDAALNTTPGIYVTDITRSGGTFTVRGLKDPLATSVEDVAAGLDISEDRVSGSMQPFQSLQPEIVAARAAKMFGKPASVDFAVSGTTLIVAGDAPWAWRRQLESRFGGLAGVDSLDMGTLRSADRQQFADRISAMAQRKYFFRSGVDFATNNEDELRRYGRELAALSRQAADLDYALNVTVTGSADTSGDAVTNAMLVERRANVAVEVLALVGVSAGVARRADVEVADAERDPDGVMRYVEVDVELQAQR